MWVTIVSFDLVSNTFLSSFDNNFNTILETDMTTTDVDFLGTMIFLTSTGPCSIMFIETIILFDLKIVEHRLVTIRQAHLSLDDQLQKDSQ